ncbi:(2Fe-2S)-binding protein [Neptunomonas japonica]|uniref:(2Fe-2S)-binding protein n=1 Tax=Neptunomonas japonica TaxID=417574 RepID=UPI0003FA6B5D|nr:(2Fe-2S)-binding protein [Neptunomonas japonica]
MFRSLNDKQSQRSLVNLTINGMLVTAPQGQTVWAAMALAGETTTRLSPVTFKARSAYCAMGVCFECMVEINGMPNQQACLFEVKEGMAVRSQKITEQTSLLTSSEITPSDAISMLAENVGGHHG